VLVALFDPLRAAGTVGDDTRAAVLIAAGVAVLLGLNLMVGQNRPMRLRPFDALVSLLLFYMVVNVVATLSLGGDGSNALLRFLRLAAQICLLYAVFGICSTRPALRDRCLRLFWWIVLATGFFALLQALCQQTGAFDLFFEYQSMRTHLAIWQVTAQFAEPALLGQFFVAALFIFFAGIDNVRRNWAGFTLIIVALGLTQSVGTLAGVLAWTLFLIVYNYRDLLSPRRLAPKLVLVLLIVVAFVSFNELSRLSLTELVSLQLDNSGEQRVTNQFALLGYLIERGWTGILFGLGENEAEMVRFRLGFGEVSGNALVELMIRYGLFAILLLGLLLISMGGVAKGLFLIAILTVLGQIDGAVAKPYIWLYTALVALRLLAAEPRALAAPKTALPALLHPLKRPMRPEDQPS
jgi:hypothetical protein